MKGNPGREIGKSVRGNRANGALIGAPTAAVSINVNRYQASELSPGVSARDTRPSTGHESGMVD